MMHERPSIDIDRHRYLGNNIFLFVGTKSCSYFREAEVMLNALLSVSRGIMVTVSTQKLVDSLR